MHGQSSGSGRPAWDKLREAPPDEPLPDAERVAGTNAAKKMLWHALKTNTHLRATKAVMDQQERGTLLPGEPQAPQAKPGFELAQGVGGFSCTPSPSHAGDSGKLKPEALRLMLPIELQLDCACMLHMNSVPPLHCMISLDPLHCNDSVEATVARRTIACTHVKFSHASM